jgi:hypothetical protein
MRFLSNVQAWVGDIGSASCATSSVGIALNTINERNRARDGNCFNLLLAAIIV